jgi:hypothetical protein
MADEQSKKELSARKFMVFAFTLTYCLGQIGNAILAIIGKISVEVFIALWGGFTPMMILIAEWYFKRDDRKIGGTGI